MTVDISDTLAPASEQLDAIELAGAPRTFVIERVSAGNAEQPVNVFLVDFPRPWRPGKSMRRVLAACWGTDASEWVGRSVTLYFDPEVTFGKDKPGGTRIRALSHIDGTKRVPLLVSRGKSAIYTVEPLTDTAPSRPTEPAPDIASITDRDVLADMWRNADKDTRPIIEARVAELKSAPAEPVQEPGW